MNFRSAPLQIRSNFACMPATFPRHHLLPRHQGRPRVGDLLTPGFGSNFVERELKHIYFCATLDAATWGAELAKGEGRGRIYIVEPTGPFEDDPNLTDKKFPGNITASYRSPRSAAHRRRGRGLGGPYARAAAGDEGRAGPAQGRRRSAHH